MDLGRRELLILERLEKRMRFKFGFGDRVRNIALGGRGLVVDVDRSGIEPYLVFWKRPLMGEFKSGWYTENELKLGWPKSKV